MTEVQECVQLSQSCWQNGARKSEIQRTAVQAHITTQTHGQRFYKSTR